MLLFILHSKNNLSDNEFISSFENYEITKLDINRMYRYINKYTSENSDTNDEDDNSDEEIEYN